MSSPSSPFLVPPPLRTPGNVVALPAPRSPERVRLVRRRPNRQQGQALEVLAHALEYLVDTRLFVYREPNTKADADAIHLLSQCSREVFATCAEVVPLRQRMKVWLAEVFHVGAMGTMGEPAGRKG